MGNIIKISSFYLAAFLLAKGYSLHNLEKEAVSSDKFLFVFNSTPNIKNDIDEFNFASEENETVLVDARKMILAIKKLKDVLYQNRT